MADRKIGTVVERRVLSPVLAVLRLVPEDGNQFPPYQAGQYIALRRENCRLTRKSVGADGTVAYVPDLDESGRQRLGAVSHAYSISSAPFETALGRHLEFYVVLQIDDRGQPGRLTESLFQMDASGDQTISYFYRITGDFTLEKRAAGFRHVVMVGTGSGLAPFAAMIKQLHYEAAEGRPSDVRFTLFHGNRTRDELGYHDEFESIVRAGLIDFVYVPSISRPAADGTDGAGLGAGRANNVLRRVLGMPLKEEEDGDAAAIARAVRPVLPAGLSESRLRDRMDPASTVILTCGNPGGMDDIRHIGGAHGIRVELEEW
jgi:ferredoxin-NADP reductase